MFRSRRASQAEHSDWPSLLSLLEDDDRRAAVERLFPQPGRDSFLRSVAHIDPPLADAILAAGRQLHTAQQLVNWPTVAIAGMLNSGKTSLVATFLSEQGRTRTLRGTSNNQGTHRFVLWLPSQWQSDAELWGLLMSRIGDALGQPPEMLSEQPAEAHQQYNNRLRGEGALAVPLVATDPQLNEYGIGLLDCPDIVTDESLGLGSPAQRRQLLGKAATLCSAFLVVSSAESSRDGALGELLRIAADLMPGVPRLLAVNKVRAQFTPDQVLETFGPLAESHGIETIYAAYDFEVPSSRPYIPTTVDRTQMLIESGDPLPVFYSLKRDPDDNPPASIAADRLLSALPGRLDRGQLFERFHVALQASLHNIVWNRALPLLTDTAQDSQRMAAKAQACLLDAALEFFAHRAPGGELVELRLHQSERIIRQLSESFAVTAPWYARWGVRLNSRVRRVFGGASDLIGRLTPSAIAERTAGEIKDRFRRGEYGGLMTPQRLTQAIDRHGGDVALEHWRDQPISEHAQLWSDAAEAAIVRFERGDFTTLDPRRLDEAVAQMWHDIPTHKKLAAGLTPLAALLATLGAAFLIPLDFGATLTISIPELFAAAGLTTLSTLWAGNKNTRHVGHQAARQQLADFHAVLCDAFGVPRPIDPPVIRVAGMNDRLVAPKIEAGPIRPPTLSLHRVRDEFRNDLQRLLPLHGTGKTR
jgi:hypothetical protein